MIKGDKEIVAAIRAHLANRIGKDRCEVWFGPTTQLEVSGANLTVRVPNQFFQDWLRSHFRKDLEAAAMAVCGTALELEFCVDEPGTVELAPARPAVEAQCPARAVAAPQPALVNSASGAARVSPAPLLSIDKAMSGALAGLPRRRLASLDSFVVGSSNALAYKAAQMSVERPGTYSPLLFHGPAGCGKSHLGEGLCTEFRRRHPRSRTVLLTAEQFTGYFLEALHGSGMPSFRRKYRDLDLLVIDDLQFFANKRATIVELLNTIDTLSRDGRQLVFTADRSPAALKALGPELTSRLSGGMVCRLEPAEFETRLGIVRNQASQLGMQVPEEVIVYIASHFTSQARELVGALKKLQAASFTHERPITLELAECTLRELADHQSRVVKLADIERAVCDVCGIQADSLQSAAKGAQISHPRMLAMWLARKYTRAGLSEIGTYFGRRSHSTVISAQRKVEGWKNNGSLLKTPSGGLSLGEMIRRVEERLRA